MHMVSSSIELARPLHESLWKEIIISLVYKPCSKIPNSPKHMSHDSAYPVGANGLVYATLIAIYVVLILLTNTVGTKLFAIGDVAFPVSLFCFPFTFLVTDIVSDIFGAKKAQYFVILGFLASLALLAFVMIGLKIPPSPAFAIETEYQAVYGPTWRLFFCVHDGLSLCTEHRCSGISLDQKQDGRRKALAAQQWLHHGLPACRHMYRPGFYFCIKTPFILEQNGICWCSFFRSISQRSSLPLLIPPFAMSPFDGFVTTRRTNSTPRYTRNRHEPLAPQK